MIINTASLSLPHHSLLSIHFKASVPLITINLFLLQHTHTHTPSFLSSSSSPIITLHPSLSHLTNKTITLFLSLRLPLFWLSPFSPTRPATSTNGEGKEIGYDIQRLEMVETYGCPLVSSSLWWAHSFLSYFLFLRLTPSWVRNPNGMGFRLY